MQKELGHFKDKRDKAAEIRAAMDATQREVERTHELIADLAARLAPIDVRLFLALVFLPMTVAGALWGQGSFGWAGLIPSFSLHPVWLRRADRPSSRPSRGPRSR